MITINARPVAKAAFVGFSGLMLSMSAAASAEPGFSSTRIGIETQDIDLSSPAGIEKLQHRVATSIRLACAPAEFGGPVNFGTHDQLTAEGDCLAHAHAAAAPQLQKLIARGNPKMASY